VYWVERQRGDPIATEFVSVAGSAIRLRPTTARQVYGLLGR
jgi:hypothetical protein